MIVMKKRRGEWVTFLRVLAILQRLQRGPATAEELITAVIKLVGPDAYPSGGTARRAAFKHDRERLRAWLQAQFAYDASTKCYYLIDPGPFFRLALSDESLLGVQLLSREFDNGMGMRTHIRSLIAEIMARLSPDERRSLEHQGDERIALDVRQDVDRGKIPERVWQTVCRATVQHRKLSFRHLSPSVDDRRPIYYEVAPQRVFYRDGHWYLRAWRLLKRDADGRDDREEVYVRFRLNYILDDEWLRIWPTVLPVPYRRPPRFLVHYLLKPEIGRGEISHHFEETNITRHADGSAEVRGYTDDLWEATRVLLSYGEGCVVLGGHELRREMLRRVKGMVRNYELS